MRLWLPRRINHCRKVLLAELEFDTPEAEVLCRVHSKLQETWDGNHELVKKENQEVLGARGNDPINKGSQVIANTLEMKIVKARKCDVTDVGCNDPRLREFALNITVGKGGCKVEHKRL